MPIPAAAKESSSLFDLLRILRQRAALIALTLALVLGTTLVVTAFLPRWYLAVTKVRVEKPEGEVKLFQAQANGAYDPYFLQDQFRIMQSEKILYPVIEHLGLDARLAASAGQAGGRLPEDLAYRYLVDHMLRIESQRSS